MKVIGLTGGVGSGKTTVADILAKDFNAHLIITDDVARKLCNAGEISYHKIVEYFGTRILMEDGQIDRAKLATIVFGDEKELERLNSFTHPFVKEYVIKEINTIREYNSIKSDKVPYIVIETALLIDAGYRELCDEVWYVAVNEQVRRERLMSSRGYTKEKIDAVTKNQMSDKDFSDNCDKILYNNGNIDNLKKEIEFLLVNKE